MAVSPLKTFWKIWDCLAIMWVIVLASFLVANFLVNYWGHGLPIAEFTFNDYGEARLESILFPIWIFMGLVTLGRMLRKR